MKAKILRALNKYFHLRFGARFQWLKNDLKDNSIILLGIIAFPVALQVNSDS